MFKRVVSLVCVKNKSMINESAMLTKCLSKQANNGIEHLVYK